MEQTKKKKRSLLELATDSLRNYALVTKQEFGRIMHDPGASDEQIADALRQLEDACGYENLPD